MEKQIMVQIDHVSKEYRLGAIGGTTLREDLARLSARIRKKEDPTLKIGQSNRHYGERFFALDDVSFKVYKGEAVGIIGRNGAGKSTLLKLLSRVTAPSKGQIGLNGRVVSMLEVGTGFHPELTGRENIYMNGAILGMTRAEIDKKIEQIIDFSECREFIDTPVKRYSSGMYVKLAFSVAAYLDSEIMIMDEVLAVGDMAFQKKCIAKMKAESKEKGRTILYVSHNMQTIRNLCERCVVLDHGKVLFDGDVEEAIAIYLKTSIADKTKYDYSSYKRSPNEKRTLDFVNLEIIDKINNKFTQKERLKARLTTKAVEKMSHVRLRIEVLNGTVDTVVGTIFSDTEINVEKNETSVFDISINLKNFAVGKYYCIGLLFEYDEYGNQIPIASVDPMFCFEMIEDGSAQVVWLHQYWGYVQFDDMNIIKIRRDLNG